MNPKRSSHNHYPPLWSINKASVSIEVMDLAAKTSHRRAVGAPERPIYDGLRRWQRAFAARQAIFAVPTVRLPRRFAAAVVGAVVGIAVVSGILVANWMA